MKSPSRRIRLLGLVAVVALLGSTVAGCSSGSNDASSGDAGAASAPEPAGADDGAANRDFVDAEAYDRDATLTDGLTVSQRPPDESTPKSVISTGNVALRSTEVAEARFEVQKVVDRYRGEISQEQTDTDDEGAIRHSRLVVRIPTADFAEAMKELEGAADLISSDTNTDDVTTKVIDLAVRLKVQRRSIARISTLLDRAQSIRDIMAIEGQLSRRQAVLGSLERQQAYLADQTRMSTITVSLERTKNKSVVKEDEIDHTGFLPGLRAGWDGLTTIAVGLATAAGALLPFAVALALLAIPGWPLARRFRARRTARTPSAA